jgi:death-on-curing protein
VIYLTLPELLHIAGRTLGSEPDVRDYGLLESAAARPQATAFGGDAYPDLDAKAAALLHSLARNHALVDGNKRLSWILTLAFLRLNGYRVVMSTDAAFELASEFAEATGSVDDIAARLRTATQSRSG